MCLKKTFSIIFIFLFFASCGKDGSNSSSSSSETSAQTATTPTPPPVEAQTFDVKVKLIGFTRSQENKIYQAVEMIKKVVASDDFKMKILNKMYNGKKTFVDNGGYSNKQIYNKILAGNEKLGDTSKNNTMDLELKLYDDNGQTIGYTYATITRIYLNKKYFDQFKPHQVAANLFHEWLHKLGFKHAVERTASRPHSVPYAIGYMMRDLALTVK